MAGAGYVLFTAGQVLTAAQVNTYLEQQTTMVFASAAAGDTALSAVKSEGMRRYLLDVNCEQVYSGSAWSTLGPVHGAWLTWAPTVQQGGSATVTVNNGAYMRYGRRIEAYCRLTATGAGAPIGGQAVGITLPVAAATSNVYAAGTGAIFDSSATADYAGQPFLFSTTVLTLLSPSSTASNRPLGVATFTAALAASDVILASFSYEAGADA